MLTDPTPLKEQLGLSDIEEQTPAMPEPLDARLKRLINMGPVVLFMKGDPR
jgi:hypothetical protein